MRAYGAAVRIVIARLLLILSVLLMPLGMAPAGASAPVHSAMAGMSSHCPDQQTGHGAKGGMADCAMACASALPAGEQTRATPRLIGSPLPPMATIEPLHGLHPDIATPPPKFS
jgi:hypothetical protein